MSDDRASIHLPWPAMGLAITSFAALYVSSDGYAGLIVLGVLLLTSYVIPFRLPDNLVLMWLVRAAAFAVIIATAGYSKAFNISVFYEPAYVNRFGYMCAVELVLRAWTRRAKGPWLAEVLFLTALIITAASNTFEHRAAFKIGAPIYTLFLILTLRRLGRPTAINMKPRPGLAAIRTIAVGLALGIGFTSVALVEKYDTPISYWAVRLLRSDRTSTQNEIGLSPSPVLGPIFNPEPSLQPVLRVSGDVTERHLRALAFDRYEARAWRPVLQERQFAKTPVPPVRQASSDDAAPAGGAGPRLRFHRLGDVLDLVILPIESTQLSVEGGIEADPLGVLRDFEEGHTRYDVSVSRRRHAQGIPARPMDDQARARALLIPEETDPELVALAKQVAGDGPPVARVIKLANYLRSHCTYSLSVDPGEGDAISNFVLRTKSGHCVFFASALAVMSRAAGVPSHFVTGYYAHERFTDDELIVRQRDAHAWTECWIDGVGWITLDATPAGGRPDQLFEKPSAGRRFWERVKSWPGRIKEWYDDQPRSHIIAFFAIVALVAVILWTLRRLPLLRKRKPADNPTIPTDPELAALARRFERALRNQQIAVSPARTWREQTRILKTQKHELIHRFVAQYEAARFGPVRLKPYRTLHALLDEIETSPSSASGRGTE